MADWKDRRVRHPFLQHRIHILWVRITGQHYAKLSVNVVREVCEYIGSAGRILAIQPNAVYSFNPVKEEWEVYVYLSREITVHPRSAYVFTGADSILLCGGFDLAANSSVPDTSLISGGKATPQAPMAFPRCSLGLVSDEPRCKVYAFGGVSGTSTAYTESLSTCESFEGGAWVALPSMQKARFNFNPCWHQDRVYVCGFFERVEVFDPKTALFLLSPLQLIRANSWTCSLVPDSDSIWAVSFDSVRHWVPSTGQCQSSFLRKPGFSWSCGPPVLWSGTLYLVDNRQEGKSVCTGVRLQDGSVRCRKEL